MSEGPKRADLVAALRHALHPPLKEAPFWAVQAMVVVIAAAHLVVDVTVPTNSGVFPAGIPVALLIVPVVYAAVRYGLAGSAATGLWATLLWLPDLTLPHDEGHVGADLANLGLVGLVALFVGQRIEAERLAHHRAEEATAARLAADARYRHFMVRVEEDERRRLARELHDEPLQLFLHLARRLESLARSPGVPVPVTEDLNESRLQAIGAAARLRELARGLRSPTLDQLGLAPALSSLLVETEEGCNGLATGFEVTGESARLADDVELGIFRIAEEAVRNTVRHAEAHRLEVALDFAADRVALTVRDDGRGFARDGTDQLGSGHFGLVGMAERASLLGGDFEVRSAPGAGTVVEARVPLGDGPLTSGLAEGRAEGVMLRR